MGRGPGRPGQRQGQVQDTGVWSRVKEAPPPLGSPRQLQFAFASKRGQALPFGPGVFEVSYSGPNALLFVASFQTPPACRHAVPVPVPVVAPQPSHPALLSGHRAAVSRGPGAAPPPIQWVFLEESLPSSRPERRYYGSCDLSILSGALQAVSGNPRLHDGGHKIIQQVRWQ